MLTTYECWLWVYVRRCDMMAGDRMSVLCLGFAVVQNCTLADAEQREPGYLSLGRNRYTYKTACVSDARASRSYVCHSKAAAWQKGLKVFAASWGNRCHKHSHTCDSWTSQSAQSSQHATMLPPVNAYNSSFLFLFELATVNMNVSCHLVFS
jgi:hypothetical protein